MLGSPVRHLLEPRRLLVATPPTSVGHAARLMSEHKVGAVLVVAEDGTLAGIFTERDALFRVVAPGLDPEKTLLREVMTARPLTVAADETLGYALLLMHEHGFRHVPVVENGRPIGVVSARYALDPDLEEFTAEAERRRGIRRRA